MSWKGSKNLDKMESTVTVRVDVTKIVKYVCFTGIVIVGIIFGTRCYQKMLSEGLIELDLPKKRRK